MSTEVYVEKLPREVVALQFNNLKDSPLVKNGYVQTRNGFESLFISDAYPRSMDCRFCYVIETGIKRQEVKIGEWIVTKPNGTVKVYSDKKFKEKFDKRTDVINTFLDANAKAPK